MTRRSSAKTRSPATCARPGACRRAAAAVAGSIVELQLDGEAHQPQRRAAGRRRSAHGDTMRSRRAARSARPPCGSSGSPPASGSAIALTVKSRRRRSASIARPRSGDEVDLPGVVGPDDAPGAERRPTARTRGPAARRPRERPRPPRATSPATRDVDVGGRRAPSSRSRTAPPTSHARAPASASRASSSGVAQLSAARRRGGARAGRARDPAGHLVVDRAEPRAPPPRRGSARRPGRRSGRPRRPRRRRPRRARGRR